ncbi:MAG: pentapeptide repeat-containing protein [Pseudomonadota bacterium]|nr:pentapeptide repeat-containing protein [Pseudomonadota bacterium]
MRFLGKWSINQGNGCVQIDPSTGTLKVAVQPDDGSERFNVYGTEAAFTLQAGNGLYVVSKGTAYVAEKIATDPVNQFSIVDDGAGQKRIVDLGAGGTGSQQFFWSNNGGTLESVARTASPPATTSFAVNIVTVGLATILQNGFSSPQPDLSWVSFAGVDFTSAANLDFTQANLIHADLSKTRFPDNTPFDSVIAQHVDFSSALLPGCSFGSAHLEGANFSQANMNGADLNAAILTGATLIAVDLTQAVNLANAVFDTACMQSAKLKGVLNIFDTSFVGANLTGVNFTGSSVTGRMDITDADLTDALLHNPPESVNIYPKMLVVSAKTNFHGTTLQYLDLSGYDLSNVSFAHADLTGCKLDNAILERTNFGYATLDGVTFTGGISMHGANLSNASLRSADLTGVQMGAVSQLFRVGSGSSDYAAFLAALRTGDSKAVNEIKAVFSKNHYPLSGTVTIAPSQFAPDTAWRVQAGSNVYSIFLETSGSETSLNIYQTATPAVLTNAFMVNANLTGANLYSVRASGVQLYATGGKQVNLNRANVNGLQANNANLGGIDLSQANLAGVNFDYAVLTGANFSGATLSMDANGGQPSFNGANLQGANFDTAVIKDVIFSNAAVAVANVNNPIESAGVWLFNLDPDQAGLVIPQLNAASLDPNARPTAAKHQFSVPIQLLPQMATGPVHGGLVTAFADANITLSKSAILVVLTTAIYWGLKDGSTDYVIFRSVNNDYQPALGVKAASQYTVDADFFLPLSVEAGLRNGLISKQIHEAFKTSGHPLSNAAVVTTRQHPTVWQVVNGADTYTLWIAFDSSVLGVNTTITARPSIPNLISLFSEVSIALSTRSTMTRIASGGWKIDNDGENPFNSARGYIEFNVLKTAAGGLNVYGSVIRIVRFSGPGKQQFTNIPCDTTRLSMRELGSAGNTICPNSATVEANEDDSLPLEEWLRARYLPSPPVCVPDPQGKFYCPT